MSPTPELTAGKVTMPRRQAEASRIVDTWPDYLEVVGRPQGASPAVLLDRWLTCYMARWPELLRLQTESYARDGDDWRAVAMEHVFPHLGARHEPMAAARDSLLGALDDVTASALRVFGTALPITSVIYVGIGRGAGWATVYEERPAVLFGLENMAECGWTSRASAPGLAAHEIGHLQHAHLRRAGGSDDGHGPKWDLYTEGFAQRFEHAVAQCESWHMATGAADPDWLAWCNTNRRRLVVEFQRRVEAGEDTRQFFGSWFEIEGHCQIGYYLGHEMVAAWEQNEPLCAVVTLSADEVRRRAREWLAQELSSPHR